MTIDDTGLGITCTACGGPANEVHDHVIDGEVMHETCIPSVYFQVRTASGRLVWDGEDKAVALRIAATSEYGPCHVVRETWRSADIADTTYDVVSA